MSEYKRAFEQIGKIVDYTRTLNTSDSDPDPIPDRTITDRESTPAPEVQVELDSTRVYLSPDPKRWVTETVRINNNVLPLRWNKSNFLFVSTKLKGIVYWTKFNNTDIYEIWVVITNAIPNNKSVYFKKLSVFINEREYIIVKDGSHVIIPRGIISKRIVVGKNSSKGIVDNYEHIDSMKYPYWARDQVVKEINRYRNRTEDSYGPYKPFWNKLHDLGDSHGGQGIAPYCNDWLRFPEGYYLRYLEFEGEIGRSPIACLDENGNILQLDEPYWLGRTTANQLDEYKDIPLNSKCSYSSWLYAYKPHDYSHMWRMIRAAVMLAPFTPWARDFLRWVWNDCKMWLEGEEGNKSSNNLFWSLDKLVSATPLNVGAHWGGRGLYHVIRCFIETSPYLVEVEVLKWREKFRKAISHIITPEGICHSTTDAPQYVYNDIGVSNSVYLTRLFQNQLMSTIYEPLWFIRFKDNFNNSILINPSDWIITIDPNKGTSWKGYEAYQALHRKGVWGYVNPKALIDASASREINGSSQDLDCHSYESYKDYL